MKTRVFRFALVALAITMLTAPVMAADLANVNISGAVIDWQPLTQHGFTLTVSGPNGYYFQDTFRSNDTPSLGGLEDGQYTYELRANATLSHRNIVQDAERGLDQAVVDIPAQFGYFHVLGGTISSLDAQEESATAQAASQGGMQNLPAADQVFLDDLIVEGSACVGVDCNNGENFGFDTLRLKENNLRIKFDDTSNSASFPNNDWQLTANESDNGGANKFSIDDVTGGKTPFTILAGAPNNSLYVDAAGDVGLNTSNPVVELHIVDGDSPTIRLEQDGSSGFQSQTWDIAGNETNFFIRDLSGGSKLPFKIKPGADDNALVIDGDNDIGIGVLNPSSRLQINDSATGNVDFKIIATNQVDSDVQFELEANTSPAFDFTDTSSGVTWRFINNNDFLRIADVGAGADAAEEFQLSPAGNIQIQGEIFTSGSCNGGCDLVFEPDYEMETIEEHAARMWSNKHLPAVGPTPENGPFNLSKMTGGILHELEKAHIFIEQLANEKKSLQERLNHLEQQMEALLEIDAQ